MSKMSPVVQVARTRLQEIDEERAALVEFIDRMTGLGRKESNDLTPPRTRTTRASRQRRLGGKSKKAKILAAAREVLNEQGCPVHLNQLCDAIIARGVTIESGDPRKYLGVLLAGAKKEFVTERGVGWRLRNEKGPAVETAEPSHLNGAEASG